MDPGLCRQQVGRISAIILNSGLNAANIIPSDILVISFLQDLFGLDHFLPCPRLVSGELMGIHTHISESLYFPSKMKSVLSFDIIPLILTPDDIIFNQSIPTAEVKNTNILVMGFADSNMDVLPQ